MAQPTPQIDGLPLRAIQPSVGDRLLGGVSLTPRQQQLLEMYNTLDATRKAQVLHGVAATPGVALRGVDPKTVIIPARQIEQLYDEQRRLNMKQGGRFGSLRDTTESDLA